MKPSVLIALIVGGVIGFAVGNVFKPSSGSAPSAAAPSPANPQAARPAGAPGGDNTVFKVPLEASPSKGTSEALVTMVEFSDYQCPFCSRAHNTVQQLQKDYGSKLRVVMKQNPLPFHNRAKPAAQAALAAGEQGKFWDMHDKMFANQTALEDANLEQYAKDIGLDVTKWKADMGTPKIAQQIDQEQKLAQSIGATGTPAFFINGRKLSGAQPIDNFKRLIDEELGKAQQLVNSGTSPDQVYAKTIENGATAPAPAPQAAAPSAPQAPAVRKVDFSPDAPARGAKNAKVTIVAWSDFQCPFCSRVVPTLKQIEDTYGKDVKIVFRHQPLPFHNNAKIAAEASMAAHEQGKFWPFHDKMFANQQALDRASLEGYAKDLGLDMGKFKAALDSNKFAKVVEADSAAGMTVGANGTPTFFVNGREFVGAQPYEAFKGVIDEEIKKADQLLAKGVKLENLYAEMQKTAGSAPPAGAPEEPAAKVLAPNDINLAGTPTKGPKNAPVTIVAYSDFQCPFCSRVVPTLKEIEKQYEGKVKIAFKNQPLPFHQNARIAAAAGLAANEQGKFWEMHDKMFANQQALDRPSLEKYAQELGLDMGKFKAALDSNKFAKVVEADSAAGMAVGANGTPTFFVNGREFVGAQPFEAFKGIIDEEVKKADQLLTKGIKLENVYAELQKNAGSAPPPGAAPEEPAAKVLGPNDINLAGTPTKGPKNAPVTIVAYSDFQCPFCSRVVPTLKQIEDTYGKSVKIA
ncbi:MAG: thioredoxin domain-containing protein, partial [Archangium sp.]|nr:thioredoxin domain-containing protein [Archangium sp.]